MTEDFSSRCLAMSHFRNSNHNAVMQANIDTNIRVCFLTGYDINASDYPDLPQNKTKILIKPVYLSQLLQVIQTLLNDDYSEAM